MCGPVASKEPPPDPAPLIARLAEETKHPGKVGPELPPLHVQAVSFVTAIAQLAGDGFRLADKKEFDRRVAICEACDLFIPKSGRCSKCGCFGSLKARGRVWTCPEGYWDV